MPVAEQRMQAQQCGAALQTFLNDPWGNVIELQQVAALDDDPAPATP